MAQAYTSRRARTGPARRSPSWNSAAVSRASDLQSYFSGLGLPVPSVTAASVDGASNAPGSDPGGADGEVLLDIEVAGSVAPGAAQVVYFAPNTDQAFVDAISAAAHATPAPIVISISWGGPEESWSAQSRTAIDQALSDAAALGITVTVAAGDNGSSDGVTDGKNHCDYPASSPYDTGLRRDPAGSRHRHRCHQFRDGVERRRLRRGHRRRRQRRLRRAVLAGQRGRAGRVRHARPGGPGRGGQRGPADRVPGAGGRQAGGLRRYQRRRSRSGRP